MFFVIKFSSKTGDPYSIPIKVKVACVYIDCSLSSSLMDMSDMIRACSMSLGVALLRKKLDFLSSEACTPAIKVYTGNFIGVYLRVVGWSVVVSLSGTDATMFNIHA
jgi:hypothetical protein